MQITIAYNQTWKYFMFVELEKRGRQLVDLEIRVQNILMIMWATPSLFKTLTNFNIKKFEKLL
jgi:hypothetical protein